jgi:AcrR family transcriptional regulator
MSATDINYSRSMGRWAPGAEGRMRDAAFELFARDGYSKVTAEQIAERAGVTERTFFRHFATKEDVFFSEGDDIIEELVTAVKNAPASATPSDVVLAAMTRLAEAFQIDRDHHRMRAEVIASDVALSERELWKRQQISATLIIEFEARGLSPSEAALIAGTGLVIFQTAYAEWVTDRSRMLLTTRIEHALSSLSTLLKPS